MNISGLRNLVASKEMYTEEKEELRRTCDACQKGKKKCDGLTICSRCDRRAKKANKIAEPCTYSRKEKPGPSANKRKSGMEPQQIVRHSKPQIPSSPASLLILNENFKNLDPTFLNSSIQIFGKVFPIINTDDICHGFHALQVSQSSEPNQLIFEKGGDTSASLFSLFACFAIGAFLQGNTAESSNFLSKAVVLRESHGELNSSSGVRGSLLLCLMFKCLGFEKQALEHLLSTEAQSRPLHNSLHQGTIKALKMLILPTSQVFHNVEQFQFSPMELESFTIDAKIFYNWVVLFIRHTLLEDGPWSHASDCYQNLLLAERNTCMQDNFPPRNWYRLQIMFLVLEITQLSLFEEANRRAMGLLDFLLKNQNLFLMLGRLREHMGSNLECVSQIFHFMKNASYYQLSLSLWDSFYEGHMSLPSLDCDWVGILDERMINLIRVKFDFAFRQHDSFVALSVKDDIEPSLHETVEYFFNGDGW